MINAEWRRSSFGPIWSVVVADGCGWVGQRRRALEGERKVICPWAVGQEHSAGFMQRLSLVVKER